MLAAYNSDPATVQLSEPSSAGAWSRSIAVPIAGRLRSQMTPRPATSCGHRHRRDRFWRCARNQRCLVDFESALSCSRTTAGSRFASSVAIAVPPFSCNCTLHYYTHKSLLKRTNLRVF